MGLGLHLLPQSIHRVFLLFVRTRLRDVGFNSTCENAANVREAERGEDDDERLLARNAAISRLCDDSAGVRTRWTGPYAHALQRCNREMAPEDRIEWKNRRTYIRLAPRHGAALRGRLASCFRHGFAAVAVSYQPTRPCAPLNLAGKCRQLR